MLKLVLAGLIVAVVGAGGAVAGPLEDGDAALQRGDYATALKVWRLLADQGNPVAMIDLGGMYELGQGVPQDFAEAVKWYRLAADQGDVEALAVLGLMYETGQRVRADYVLSYMWFSLAAASQPDGPKRHYYVSERDRVATLMTYDQVAEAQRLAREWKPKPKQ